MNRSFQSVVTCMSVVFLFAVQADAENLDCKRVSGSESRGVLLGPLFVTIDSNSNSIIGGGPASLVAAYSQGGGTSTGIVSAGGFYNCPISSSVADPSGQCFETILLDNYLFPELIVADSYTDLNASFEVQPSIDPSITSGQAIGYISVIGGMSGTAGEEYGEFDIQIGPYRVYGAQLDLSGWHIRFEVPGESPIAFNSYAQNLIVFFEFPVSVNSIIPMDLMHGVHTFSGGSSSVEIESNVSVNFSVEAYDPNDANPVSQAKVIRLLEEGEEEEIPIYSDEEE